MELTPEVAALLGDAVRETSRATGREFFRSLVRSLAQLLDVRYCMVTQCLDSPPTRVQSLAFWSGESLADTFEYSVLGTPCEAVMLGDSRRHGRDIQTLFPEDDDLRILEAESYAAAPILGRDGVVLGHLLVMDDRPLDEHAPKFVLLEIFAERAAAELERAQAIDALEASRATLRQVIDLVPHFIFARDREGTFILANRALAEAYGTRPDQLVGRKDADFNPSAEDVERFRRDDLEVISSGEIKVIDEEELVDADGRVRRLQTTKIPFDASESELPAMLGVAIDITRQRRLEEQRRVLQEQVLHAQKMESLGVLAGGLAHDFNNLLTSILGNVDLAAEALAPGSPAHGYLEHIGLAAHHSARLAGQMLAYSGKGNFVFTRIDLNALIQEMSNLLGRSVSKKARLRLELQPGLPAMIGDATQLRQVVMNLILNASDALENGEGTILLRSSASRLVESQVTSALTEPLPAGDYLQLEVEDDGCGMESATLERLFDPFFTTKTTGRGLGLAALLGIVRSHGGAVAVDSRPGDGTVFTVLFAAADDEQLEAHDDAPPPAPRTHPEATEQDVTILVADDEELVRRVTRELLERQGYRVLLAVDGEEAVQTFACHRGDIDAVILDITMPKLDGLETMQKLKAIDPDVKILLASGYSEQTALDARHGGDVHEFLEKPFRAAELKRKLDRVLSRGE